MEIPANGESSVASDAPAASVVPADSEQRYRQLMALLPVAVYTCDASGTITFYNEHAAALWGRAPRLEDPAERFGGSARLYRPDGTALPHDQTPMAIALSEGRALRNEELVIEQPDGTRITVRASIDPLRDAAGHVVGAINVFQDAGVIDLRRAEQFQARLAAIVESSDDGIVSKELDGTITSWNSAAERLFGYSAEEAIGQSIFMLIPSDRLHEEAAIIERIRRGERVQHYETLRRRRDGTLVDVSISVSPITDRHGRVIGASKIARDITIQKLAEKEKARLYAQAHEANRAKDEFLATLSHELRTPLNAMLGWSHMLRSVALPPATQRRALDSLERNARAQAQLVEDLLDVSRIASGKIQIRSDDVDLTRVVAEAVDSIRPAVVAKALDLRTIVDPETVVVVKGDADRLRQVVWNLLSNATKFTPPGGQVRVEVRVAGATVQVIVEDTGEGIPRRFLQHVFERFQQADSTSSRRHGGLGLGLAIVRYLIEAHGGTVAADSAGEGCGARFTVTLPVCATRATTEAVSVRPRVDTPVLPGARVLVVDDQADARDLVRVVLEVQGATVTTAASAGEALHALSLHFFDVLIADIGMPEQDGFALIQAVRALKPERGGTIPAIAATAYASVRERARALDAGFDWHLAKPLDPEQLIAAVQAATKQSATKQSATKQSATKQSARG